MNVYMVSKGHIERMHSLKWLYAQLVDVIIVTHTAADRDRIERHINTNFPGHKFQVVSTGRKTLVENRNLIHDIVPDNEWYIGLDDNILELQAVPSEARKNYALDVINPLPISGGWRTYYRHPERLRRAVARLVSKMESNGTFYGGFASTENPYFRAKQWSYRRFVKSKLFVMRKVEGVQWKTEYLHDSYMSALAVAMCGRVVVDNWTHPAHKMYEIGGLGGDRQAKIAPELPLVIKEFEGLVGKARGANSALRFLLTGDNSVNAWRREHGYL